MDAAAFVVLGEFRGEDFDGDFAIARGAGAVPFRFSDTSVRLNRFMAQRYDVSLKALFVHDGDGIIRRRLFGGRVTEHLASEQPQVSNRRADMVVRTEDGSLHQVEFQAANEANFGLRMLEYYTFLVCSHRQHVVQTVLYLGREALGLERGYRSPSMDFQFEIVNLRELDAELLLESEDWADIALALLARGDREKALAVAVSRLGTMGSEERAWASGTLLFLSGILGIEETVNERMKEAGMIDLMENKVVGPLILEAERKGRSEGMQVGMYDLLLEQLTEKFGAMPEWALERLQAASAEELHTWAKRILRCTTLDETLR